MGHADTAAPDMVPPTLFLSDDDVAVLADWRDAVDALHQAYSGLVDPAMVPPRSMARGQNLWLRGLSAVSPSGRHMGCKLIAASMAAKRASYLISLFDQKTMALSALIDGNRITGIRTAAAAVVAVNAAAPARPLRIGVIGAGFEAQGLVAALAAVREIAELRVFSPTPTSRDRFAALCRERHGLVARAVPLAPEAVDGADVVLCAARSRDESPVLRGAWLAPGMTVVSIGSTLPEQREVDEQVIARAAVIVADMPDEVAHDTGDMLAATRAGIDFRAKLVSLSDLLAGRATRPAEGIVLYKSVGSALQDVITAEMLLARAQARGIGSVLARSIVPVAK
ncbi:NAD(P)-binding domain-containing protein [uncultured Pseudacidovorax sp.]|uniref:ornithine cyclodeaminase family protein n=1 Tax=uncultured Pseudacidovorax sp. TaxID=679313 RepID=UPI0025EA5CE9|nr:NAD(P)-binding domain-containing protein [uncultured Pseudacidovorax sp.]